MFGTLHYNAGSNETQYVERSDGVAEHGGNATAHFACDNCRAKKVEWTAPVPILIANGDALPT